MSKNCKYKDTAKKFISELPYKKYPYSGRNWGHSWHSLCSYHGKLKPSIAYFLVNNFTEKGDIVLDPLCGVGTIPLEACLQGRIGVGNDLSQLAYVVTKAKLEKPSFNDVMESLYSLSNYINSTVHLSEIDEDIVKYSTFGFNGALISYFHNDTFREILCARRYYIKKIDNLSSAESMVFSCLLHVLHGNRPYALSRCSHPLTPYAPKGDFEYKNVIEHINRKIESAYSEKNFTDYTLGNSIWGDYNELKKYNILADEIICSPPFADSIKFYMQNWMRLWLCGWELDNFKNADKIFIDQRQKKDFDIYLSFFEICSKLLKPKGKVILHLGKTQKVDMAKELSVRSEPFFNEIYRGEENVEDIEKHGIKDKGATLVHQFLFLEKK